MEFFVTRPNRSTTPIIDGMLMDMPVRNRSSSAPTMASGSAAMMVKGWMKDSNCEASTK